MASVASAQTPVDIGRWWQMAGLAHVLRARLRLASALVLLSFVVCHLTGHIFLLVSIPVASHVAGFLMAIWWTATGALVLATALLVHFLNALWSIYVRRSLRLSRWEWAQVVLGLAIIPRWASRLAVPGVRYLPLEMRGMDRLNLLPLAAAWVRGSRDPVRDELMATLRSHLRRYAAEA